MSTRATYRINGSTFYIHHDGYPEYAVEYFKAALSPAPEIAIYAEAASRDKVSALEIAFFLVNERAERIDCHERHADTEHRYDVDGDMILHRAKSWKTSYSTVEFYGKIKEFIEKYQRP